MLFRVLIALFLAGIGIVLALRVNRRANVATTVTYVLLPFVTASFAWNDWSGWHTSSGNVAVQYAIAFVLMCVAVAGMLIALGRRIGWLRHHQHEGWTGWDNEFGTGAGGGGAAISGRQPTSAGARVSFLLPIAIALLLGMMIILSVLTLRRPLILILVPIAMWLPVMSILFVFTVNIQGNVARTVLCVILPVLSASLVWSYWHGWHTSSSGNDALQYAIAFVCLFVTFAATLIAFGRRVGWLRHHQHDG